MPSKKDLNTNPGAEGRRFLIAAGTAHYRYLEGQNMPSVADDIRLVVDCFTELGTRGSARACRQPHPL